MPIFNAYWDFSSIEEVTPTSALVIASEYDRLQKLHRWTPGAINVGQWDKNVFNLLKAIGFLELCGVDKSKYRTSIIDGFKFRKMTACEEAVGKELVDFFEDVGLDTCKMNPEIYSGLFEALLNTRNHAYIGSTSGSEARCWWMFGSYHQERRNLVLAVYDHGISIPVSLLSGDTKWSLLNKFKDMWQKLVGASPSAELSERDGEVLKLAMELGKTRTHQSHRGKGLPAIDNVVDVCSSGSVAIRSRRGQYLRHKGEEPILSTHVQPLRGTLVVWDVQLPEGA